MTRTHVGIDMSGQVIGLILVRLLLSLSETLLLGGPIHVVGGPSHNDLLSSRLILGHLGTPYVEA